MKTVGIRELKTHLSAHLRDVERGDVVLVTDRGRVVAELRPPGTAATALTPAALARQRLVDVGLLRPAAAPGSLGWTAPLSRLVRAGAVRELLDADREDRG